MSDKPISFHDRDHYYGQIGIDIGYLSVKDREFIADLLKCKLSHKKIDKWFNSKDLKDPEQNRAWTIAQGVLAACYRRDPP